MKTLLTVTLVSICVAGFYSKEISSALGLTVDPQAMKPITLEDLTRDDGKHRGMSAQEFAELSKKDPDALRKFLESHQEPQERNEVDKLMNLFAHGKYE